MRDPLCNVEDLIETIDFNEEVIIKRINKIKEIQQDILKGIQNYPIDNEEVIYNTRTGLFQLNNELLRAKYSLGKDCSELEEGYLNMLEMLEYAGYHKLGYINFICMIGLGILLETDKENMVRLAKLADEAEVNDILVDFLLASYGIEREMKSSTFDFGKPYEKTLEIIQLATQDKTEASKRLQKYMEKEWYQGHYSIGWKNAHKDAGYYGFWSYETAALAKILKLEDTALKSHNRYPYDLAHYKNEREFHVPSLEQIITEETPENVEDFPFGMEQNRELEPIIPRKYHQSVNQMIEDYKNISDSEFWKKYHLKDIWFFEEEYVQEKSQKDLLGTLIVFYLVDQGHILQLDYKEEVEDYMDEIPNNWTDQDVKLVRLELDNDQNYYMYIPKDVQMNHLYEVRIIEE